MAFSSEAGDSPDSPYAVRNYRPDDLDGYVSLRAGTDGFSALVLRERLGRPNYSPDCDLFVALLGTSVVGYLDVSPEPAVGRTVMECLVQPEHRRRGLGTGLFHQALRRAAESGAGVAHVNAGEDNAAASQFLDRLGFVAVRRYLEMSLDLPVARLTVACPGGIHFRPLRPGEEDRLTRIQNRAFEGSWGFSPNTEEDVGYRLNMSDTSPQHVVLALEGDAVAGYCWTTLEPEAGGRRAGRVHMLGVAPESRGRGVGRQVLAAALDGLKGTGIDTVRLTVDSRNASARAVYDAIGFETVSTTLWYEKEVVSGP